MGVKKNEKGQFMKGNNFVDLKGNRYGKLIVVSKSDKVSGRKTFWNCLCDCGKTKIVRSDSLTRKEKATISCGCMKKERALKNFGIVNNHGLTKHPIFTRWNAMMNRCNSENNSAYENYGGRGIKVCEEWQDVSNFIKWSMENGFKNDLTIDRIDVNGNYEPSNCRWVSMDVQHYNKRTNVYHEYKGLKLTTMQWQRKLNIPISEVWSYKSKDIDFIDLIIKYEHNPEVNN